MNQNISRNNVQWEIDQLDHSIYCTEETVKKYEVTFDEDKDVTTNLVLAIQSLENQIKHYKELIDSVGFLRKQIDKAFTEYDSKYCK